MHNSDNDPKRDFIISKLREFRASRTEGQPSGKRYFCQETGISEYQLDLHFGGWQQALMEAGFTAGRFGEEKKSDDSLFMALAELTRVNGNFPSMPQLMRARKQRGTSFPAPKTFENRWPKKEQRREALLDWVGERPEYKDVLEILRATINEKPAELLIETSLSSNILVSKELQDSYLPPVVSCLDEMAKGTQEMQAACTDRLTKINVEFEKRVAIALQLLGLSVEKLGQGLGRIPDGIAKCQTGRWAIIYDAKVRSGEFRLNADEERKFKEYIEQSGLKLRSQGFDKFYFAVISSKFCERDLAAGKELCRLTNAKSFIFLRAETLMRLIEKRLRHEEYMQSTAWLDKELMHTRIF